MVPPHVARALGKCKPLDRVTDERGILDNQVSLFTHSKESVAHSHALCTQSRTVRCPTSYTPFHTRPGGRSWLHAASELWVCVVVSCVAIGKRPRAA